MDRKMVNFIKEQDCLLYTSFLDRRRPGKSPLSTARKEADAPEFLSGLRDVVTCGSPLCAVIYNSDQHSSDYTERCV